MVLRGRSKSTFRGSGNAWESKLAAGRQVETRSPLRSWTPRTTTSFVTTRPENVTEKRRSSSSTTASMSSGRSMISCTRSGLRASQSQMLFSVAYTVSSPPIHRKQTKPNTSFSVSGRSSILALAMRLMTPLSGLPFFEAIAPLRYSIALPKARPTSTGSCEWIIVSAHSTNTSRSAWGKPMMSRNTDTGSGRPNAVVNSHSPVATNPSIRSAARCRIWPSSRAIPAGQNSGSTMLRYLRWCGGSISWGMNKK